MRLRIASKYGAYVVLISRRKKKKKDLTILWVLFVWVYFIVRRYWYDVRKEQICPQMNGKNSGVKESECDMGVKGEALHCVEWLVRDSYVPNGFISLSQPRTQYCKVCFGWGHQSISLLPSGNINSVRVYMRNNGKICLFSN